MPHHQLTNLLVCTKNHPSQLIFVVLPGKDVQLYKEVNLNAKESET